MFNLFILSLWVVLSAAVVVKWRDCPAGSPDNPLNGNKMTIAKTFVGCEAEPCVQYTGESYLYENNITLYFTTKSLWYKTFAISPMLPVPVPFDSGIDFCEFVTVGNCFKFTNGTTISIRRKVTYGHYLPSFTGHFRVIFTDDKDVPQFCGEIAAVLKSKTPLPLDPLG